MSIATALSDRSLRRPDAIHDAYPDDSVRRDVLRHLLPAARVEPFKRKAEVPHHRRLDLRLRDGRRVLVLLDQGFGGWRAQGTVRHDFAAAAVVQARLIRDLQVSLTAAESRGCPATVEVE